MFEIPYSESYEINGHEHIASSKSMVSINPKELVINKDITRHLRLEDIRIKGVNMTSLDNSFAVIGQLKKLIGKNATIEEIDISKMLLAPLGALKDAINWIWQYAQVALAAGLGILAIVILIAISPVIQIIMLMIRLAYGRAKGLFVNSKPVSKTRAGHYV